MNFGIGNSKSRSGSSSSSGVADESICNRISRNSDGAADDDYDERLG